VTTANPVRRERPADQDALVRAMAQAAAAGDAVAVIGGGTALGYGFPAERRGIEIDSTRLDRVVSYAPGDLVVEVEAGITLAAIERLTAPDGLRLALDPPDPERATIGGAVAVNAFGPRRARFGGLRDVVVGMSLVRADGTLVRGGGRVVKNVAGFDIPKLAIGSLGTLGAIATVTLRLHPLPVAAAAFAAELPTLDAVLALELALEAARLEPAATLATRGAGGGWTFVALFEGFPAGVAEQLGRATEIVASRGATAVEIHARGALAADGRTRGAGDLRLHVAIPRASLGALDAVLEPLARALEDERVVAYPSLGVAFVSAGANDPDAALAALGAARAAAEALGGTLVATACGPLAGRFDPFGAPPPAFALMRTLRARFDPDRRLNPGRFLGGL